MVHQNQATRLCLELVAELDITPVVKVLATRRMQELHRQGALHQGFRKIDKQMDNFRKCAAGSDS